MNRRGFLAALFAVAVTPDPDNALWVPGQKLISIPAARNVLITPDVITKYTLVTLQNHAMLAAAYSGRYGTLYGNLFNPKLLKLGYTITVREPARFVGWSA